jgi:hypothetical protein
MKLFFAALTLCFVASAQTVTQNPDTPQIPASLSVFADKGDLTYCVATAVKGTKPIMQLTCRRSGVTHVTTTFIDSTTFVDNGDQSWLFMFNSTNPQQIQFQVSVNVRDNTGVALSISPTALTGEFQIGDSVKNGAGTASGTVAHWTHQSGVSYSDGKSQATFAAMLVLTNVTGTFGDTDAITSSNASGNVQKAYNGLPPMNPFIKSGGLITWPTTTSLWHRLLRK